MFQGINCVNGELAGEITRKAFKRGLIIETSGADDHVVKFLCPLVISNENLARGIDIVEQAIHETCAGGTEIPSEIDYFEGGRKVA
jgi:diaminobutyrate-2-oxoglutarate transaminase